jgi:hypothetical protein
VQPEDVVHVLRNMVKAVRSGGTVLDLQVIRPNPRVEIGDELLCEVDGEPLFRRADAATNAIDALIGQDRLSEQAIDDHDVRTHYPAGADLVDDFNNKERQLPEKAIPQLLTVAEPCAVRERCRLRLLSVR